MRQIINKILRLFKSKSKSATERFAERELDLLSGHINCYGCSNPFGDEYREGILALVRAFVSFDHSGSSAPIAAAALADVVKSLCLQESVLPIVGSNSEWHLVISHADYKLYQNRRCGALFKEGLDANPYYLDAIVWVSEDDQNNSFTGTVEGFNSRQYVKSFPFQPLTFKVKVGLVPVNACNKGFTKEHTYRILDRKQLEAALDYYRK